MPPQRRALFRIAFLVALSAAALIPAGTLAASTAPAPAVAVGRAAPLFTLPDIAGQRHSLAEYRGRPLALFFFCGCEPCHRCARAWGQIQRDAFLPLPSVKSGVHGADGPPQTLVVFLGEAAEAHDFLATVGLDARQTVVLTDPSSRTALDYDAEPCPRVFVLDAGGVLRYTNSHKDDAPPDAPAAIIASRALESLRAAEPPPPPAADRPVGGLTVVAAGGAVRSDGPDAARRDFGPVDPLVTARLEPVFTLRCDGPSPVTIERLKASCGCTSALLGQESGGEAALPWTLAPGQQADVRVSVELSHLHGRIEKYVYVYASGQANPAATLRIDAQIREILAVSPPALDFGRVEAGAPRTLPLTVTLDPRLLPPGAPLRLVSSNPDIQVAPAAPDGDAVPRPGQTIRHTYTVTLLPGARVGALFGRLSVAPEGTKGGAPDAAPEAAALLTNFSVYVSGRVTGEVSAAPESVVFGAVTAGKPVTRSVLLSARSAAALRGIRATAANPWLSVRVRAAQPNEIAAAATPTTATGGDPPPPAAVAVLEVSLSPEAPPGGISTEVTVVTARSERLVLPILAAVRPAGSAARP